MLETSPSPRWQRRPDARPDEILDAALQVFGAQGFAGARLEDIARTAGVSKGTLYLYFDSKEEMFRAMVRARIVSVLEASERELLHAEGSTRTKLELLMRRIWVVVGDPSMARIIKLVHGELNNFPELARFYYEEVILRVRALGLGGKWGGVEGREEVEHLAAHDQKGRHGARDVLQSRAGKPLGAEHFEGGIEDFVGPRVGAALPAWGRRCLDHENSS